MFNFYYLPKFYHSHKKQIVWKQTVEIYQEAQNTGDDFKKNIAFPEGKKQILC